MAAAPPYHHHGENPSKLSAEINKSTRDVHDSINKTIMLRVGLGLRDLRNFREGILSFFYIYQTFESEWNRLLTTHPPTISSRKLRILQTMHSPILLRTQPFLADLAFYFSLPSPSTASTLFSTPTTPGRIAYQQHIRAAIAKEPLVIIAYAHSMYLALFAGGKIIRSKMLGAVGFWPNVEGRTSEECQRLGTNMFVWECEKGREEEMVRGAFKRRLAEVEGDLTAEEKEAIILESREIFIQNGKLIEELDRLTTGNWWLGVLLMALASFLAYRVCTATFPGVLAPLMVIMS